MDRLYAWYIKAKRTWGSSLPQEPKTNNTQRQGSAMEQGEAVNRNRVALIRGSCIARFWERAS